MNATLVEAVLAVIAVWAVAAVVIRRFGPGRVCRRVYCPEKHVAARVVAVQSEAGFGTLRTTDIVECNLLAPLPIDCGKRCLAKL